MSDNKKFINLSGIIYDLDGTVISSEKINKDGWQYAANSLNFSLTDKMLTDQKGRTDTASARIILQDKTDLIEKFIKTKQNHVEQNLKSAKIFPGFIETINILQEKGIDVWICTSIIRRFVDIVLDNLNELKKFKDRIIYKEMYIEGKPSAEPLLLTLKNMGNIADNCIYVGDAYNDYLSAKNAKMKGFIYFCPQEANFDNRIPKSITKIKKHKELLNLI